jgi:transposase
MRDAADAIVDALWSMCQRRYLPKALQPTSAARRDFDAWRHNGTPNASSDVLRSRSRRKEGKQRTAPASSIDRQSVTMTEGVG